MTKTGAGTGGVADEAERAIVRIVNSKADAHMAFVLIEERVNFKRLGLRHGTALRVILSKDPKQKQFYCTTTAAGLAAQQEANLVTAELGPYFALLG